jgi:hydroxypyruvate reductase
LFSYEFTIEKEKIMNLRSDAQTIINHAIASVLPDTAVEKILSQLTLSGNVYLVAIGKAAYQMAKAAYGVMQERIKEGVVVTKYGHAAGNIGPIRVYEAGHPVLDQNSVKATEQAIALVNKLRKDDTVVFLVSGGGSALFEIPLIPLEELQDINLQLLSKGANIVEINTIRKRLSGVKGGRFAEACAPARVISVVLSDIVGDPLDMIASGPAYPDGSTCADANAIVKKYDLKLSESAMTMLNRETPKQLDNVETYVTGSVRQLCKSAAETAAQLGYEPVVLTASLTCQARGAGN